MQAYVKVMRDCSPNKLCFEMVDKWPNIIRLYFPVKSWFLLRLGERDRDSFKAEKE